MIFPGQSRAEKLAAIGLSEDDFPPEELAIWPDLVQSFQLMTKMRTQWRIGPRGASGLDYGVLFQIMQMSDITGKEAEQLFSDIRAMEIMALNLFRSA